MRRNTQSVEMMNKTFIIILFTLSVLKFETLNFHVWLITIGEKIDPNCCWMQFSHAGMAERSGLDTAKCHTGQPICVRRRPIAEVSFQAFVGRPGVGHIEQWWCRRHCCFSFRRSCSTNKWSVRSRLSIAKYGRATT